MEPDANIAWFFFAASLVGLGFTWNAFRPWFAPAPFAVVSFFAGWLTAELALHHLVIQAILTGGFIAAGALSAWPGQVALGFTLVNWAGLVLLYRKGHAARHSIDAALREALGDYESEILPEVRAGITGEMNLAHLALPFPVRHRAVERIRNLPFHEMGGIELKLDVFRHRSRPRGCPTLLFIHGGAWMIRAKDYCGLPFMMELAARGWVCVAASYRVSPRATFPDHLVDVKHALRWVRERGPEFGADPDLLIVSGESAGGHLAALVALTAGDPAYQPGFEAIDTSVSGCVCFYGVYDFACDRSIWKHRGMERLLERHVMKTARSGDPQAYARASPITLVHEDAPPFLVVHGELDTLVPVAEARRFAAALRGVARAPVAYAEIAGAQHAFELFPSPRTHWVVQGATRFCAWLQSRRARVRTREATLALGAE
jgi:acetyl esterase/lipase